MWTVVVTEIQDAHALGNLEVPPGAYFVSTERFARTVENLDLQTLKNAINQMQSSQDYTPKESRIAREKALR